MIFNTSGGGDPLNFKVVGGTAQPSNPQENTIWVNTATEITSWVFSATQPTGAEGMVWLKTDDNELKSFNALKKNGIALHPVLAMQYLNGAWVTKTAKIYQDSAWQELTLFLYRAGDRNTGFVAKPWKFYSGGSGMTPSITYYGDSVIFQATDGQAYGGVVHFPNKIDLTYYSTLTANAALWGSTNPDSMPEGLYVWESIGSDSGYGSAYAAKALFNGTGKKTLSVDVSGLSGKYYVGFGLRGEAPTYESIVLTEVKLE